MLTSAHCIAFSLAWPHPCCAGPPECVVAPVVLRQHSGQLLAPWLSYRRMLHSSRLSMVLQRSRASLSSLVQVSPRMHRIWPHCRCPLEVVAFEAPSRSKEAAHWASWERHPDVAALMVRALPSAEEGRHLHAAESCRLQLLSLGRV